MWHFIRQSVILQEDKLTLSLSASKTDFFKRNVTLFIVVTDDKACAVILLKHLFINFFASSNFFLFQTFAGFPFIRDIFIDKIKKILLQHNYWNNYSKHSFKKNAAISVKTAELSDNKIQLLEWWKSDVYRLYIDLDPEAIIRASRRHQQGIHNWIPHAASAWTTRQAPPFGLGVRVQGNIASKNRCWCFFQRAETTKMLSWFVKILFKRIMQKFYGSRIRRKIKSAFSLSKILAKFLQSWFIITWTLWSQFATTSFTIRHRMKTKTDSPPSHEN